MKPTQSANNGKTEQNQSVALSALRRAAGKAGVLRDAALFAEFSDLMDKIAAQLSDNQAEVHPAVQLVEKTEKRADHAAPTAQTKSDQSSSSRNSDEKRDCTTETPVDEKAARSKDQEKSSDDATKADSEESVTEQTVSDASAQEVSTSEDAVVVSTAAAEQSKAQPAEVVSKEIAESKVSEENVEEAPVEEDSTLQSFEQVAGESKEAVNESSSSATAAKTCDAKESVKAKCEPVAAKGEEAQPVVEEVPAATPQQSVATEIHAEIQSRLAEKHTEAQQQQAAASERASEAMSAAFSAMLNLQQNAMGGEMSNSKAAATAMIHAKISAVTEAGAIGTMHSSANSNAGDGSTAFKPFEFQSSKDTQSASRPLTRTNAARAMERVEAALKEVAQSRDGKTISVRLDPPDLGTVKVDVSIRQGSLHARISAESDSVTVLLRERALDLQSMLRKLGLNVDRVSVAIASSSDFADQAPAHFSFNEGRSQSKEDSSRGNAHGSEFGAAHGVAGHVTSEAALDHWVA